MGRGKIEAGTPEELLDIVGRIYEAALRPAEFSGALAGVASVVNAKTGAFVVEDVASRRLVSTSTLGIGLSELATYERDWLALDHGLHAVLPGLPPHAIATERDVPNFRRSEIYDGYFGPLGMDHMMGCLAANDRATLALVAFHRPKALGHFSEYEQDRFRLLVPHLSRAATIQRTLLDGASRAAVTADALDALATAVVLLDARGATVLANRAALGILEAGDGLSLRRGGLLAALADEDRRLQQLIRSATRTGAGLGVGAGGALRISRPSLRRDLLVMISPLHVDAPSLSGGRTVAVVFIRDPESQAVTEPEVLQRLWQLTSAEARVCAELVQGWTVEEIAGRQQVALDTVRKHLRQIFAKTGTNRQASLTTLILSSLAGMGRRMEL